MPGEKPEQRPLESIDLNALLDRGKVSLTIANAEDASERQGRLAQEQADAALRRRKDFFTFILAGIMVAVVFTLCVVVVIKPAGWSSDDRRWAQLGLSIILSGSVGYLMGKASK